MTSTDEDFGTHNEPVIAITGPIGVVLAIATFVTADKRYAVDPDGC